MASEVPPQGRPYRSHLRPACNPCRVRKSVCKSEPSQPGTCMMCRTHGTNCEYPDPSAQKQEASSPRPRKQRKLNTLPVNGKGPPNTEQQSPSSAENTAVTDRKWPDETPFPDLTDTHGERELHIVGPVRSTGTAAIAKCTAKKDEGGHVELTATGDLALKAGDQHLEFREVRKQPLGTVLGQTLASIKCHFIQKLIDPFCKDIIDIYFEKVHPSFPLLDRKGFMAEFEQQRTPPTLLASVIAQSMVFWKQRCNREVRHCPDLRFVWNQANEALHSDLHLSPDIFTVVSVLLNVSGRPLTSMIGNGVILRSAISVAQSLGINRRLSPGQFSDTEKALRNRIWWNILVLDKWSSVAYGTPPATRRSHYDVPPPTFVLAYAQNHDDQEELEPAYVGLVLLSEVLDLYLEHVFDVRSSDSAPDRRSASEFRNAVKAWEDKLPQDLKQAILHKTDSSMHGASNLRLSYLYVKLLLEMVELEVREDTPNAQAVVAESLLAGLIEASEKIVSFVEELDEAALGGFWQSTNAFALEHTVACLLRCATDLSSSSPDMSKKALDKAQDLLSAVERHRRDSGWDIGNICIGEHANRVAGNGKGTKAMLSKECLSGNRKFDYSLESLWRLFEK